MRGYTVHDECKLGIYLSTEANLQAILRNENILETYSFEQTASAKMYKYYVLKTSDEMNQ